MDQSKNRGQTSPATTEASTKAAARDAETETETPRKGKRDESKVNEQDFPRMLHKGEARMTVHTEQELKDAKGDGWDFHHTPPVQVDPAQQAEAVIREEHRHIAAMNDISQLETLRNELVGQPIVAGTRTAEVRAIEARIAQLRAVNQPKPVPAPPKDGVPAAGDVAVRAEIAVADVARLKLLRESEASNPGGPRPGVMAAIAQRMEDLAS